LKGVFFRLIQSRKSDEIAHMAFYSRKSEPGKKKSWDELSPQSESPFTATSSTGIDSSNLDFSLNFIEEDYHSNFHNYGDHRTQARTRTNRNTYQGRQRRKQPSLNCHCLQMEELQTKLTTVQKECDSFKQFVFVLIAQLRTEDKFRAKKERPVYQINGGQCFFNEKPTFLGGIFSGGSGIRQTDQQRGSQLNSQPRLDIDDLD